MLEAPPDPTRVAFDQAGQTVDALALALEHLQRVPAHPMSWKWAVIGMHATLQGCFGLVLRRGEGSQLLTPDQERQYRARVNRERTTGRPEPMGFVTKKGKPQDPRIDDFLELFRKVQDPDRMKQYGGVALRPTADQTERIEYLHANRGKLIHFSDGSFLLSVPETLHDLTVALTIAEILLTQTRGMADGLSGPVDTILDGANADRARELLAAIRSELAAVHDRYGLSDPEPAG